MLQANERHRRRRRRYVKAIVTALFASAAVKTDVNRLKGLSILDINKASFKK